MYWVFTEDQLEKALDEWLALIGEELGSSDFHKQIKDFLFSEETKKLRRGK